ncbi:hypothetical protein AB0E85_35815 [Streptomyces sp. NPDC029044]|uniref:hypothetical protein n=1 Tax=Streptomyces sp. NPDC029044 TaxID=3157198 RepID=UPI0033F9A3E7
MAGLGLGPARHRARRRAAPTPYGPYEAVFDGLPTSELIAHEGARLAQMRDTVRWTARSAGPGRPVILTGDFNTPSHVGPCRGGHHALYRAE